MPSRRVALFVAFFNWAGTGKRAVLVRELEPGEDPNQVPHPSSRETFQGWYTFTRCQLWSADGRLLHEEPDENISTDRFFASGEERVCVLDHVFCA